MGKTTKVPPIHTPESIKPDESLLEPLREKLLKFKDEKQTADEKYVALDEAELEDFLSTDHLNRFLVARSNNFDKAYQMTKDAYVWRCKYHPTKLTVANDFAKANAQGVWRFMGYAKNGWPILLVRAAVWDPSTYSLDEYIRMVAYYMEGNIQRMTDPKNHQHFLLFDMKGMSYFKSDMRKLLALAKMTADYFPERLGVGVAINVDMLTMACWSIMSRILDKRTKDKAFFFRKNYQDFLDEHIGLENITEDLGGTRKEDWLMVMGDSTSQSE
jgi:hypothetical protein